VGVEVWHYNDARMIKDIGEITEMVDGEVDIVLFGYDF
jgi:hypothetical protein